MSSQHGTEDSNNSMEHTPDITQLEQTLEVSLNDPALLHRALVHSSFANENPGTRPNERLEFLGDAVLDLVIGEELFQHLDDADEGELTKRRAAIVSGQSCARVAAAINLGDYLFLGKGEEASNGRHKQANLAGSIEAVIAAIYLDLGMETVHRVIKRLFCRELEQAYAGILTIDYKSKLQEIVQANNQELPVYKLVSEDGPGHDKTFTVTVMVDNKIMATASGKSKKTAEILAARYTLKKLEHKR